MEQLEIDDFCAAAMQTITDNDLPKLKQLLANHHSTSYHYEMDLSGMISWSIYKNNDDMTYYLLSSKDILRMPGASSINGGEIPAILTAATAPNYELVKYMLTSKDLVENARIDIDNHGLLSCITRCGNIDMIDYLLFSPELKEHADYKADEYNPVKMIGWGGHIPALQYMLKKFNDNQDEILEAAVSGAIEGKSKELLSFAFNMNEKYKASALFYAMMQEKREMQEYLIVECNMKKTPQLEQMFELLVFKARPEKKFYAEKLFEVCELQELLPEKTVQTKRPKV